MEYTFTVKRNRFSTTQGSATVYLNGEEMITFDDKIELIDGKWQSVKSDADFIKGLLFHPYDDLYQISKKVKEVLER